jgi:hypothetical protein
MNGLWKENISGWNNKDTKRKKQTRKHYLRDKGRLINNNFGRFSKKNLKNDSIYRVENEQEILYNRYESMDIKKYAEVFKISLVYYELDENYIEDKNREVHKELYVYTDPNEYHYSKVFYEETSKKELNEYLGLYFTQKYNITEIKETGRKVETDWEILKEKYDIDTTHLFWTTEKIFMYNKPLSDWKLNSFYCDGKRRKYAQKIAHSKDRQNLRYWLSKEDWDAEIKTHALSKSILWEVW